MIVRTDGIVLSYTKYRDTSIITKILTEEYGLHSFIVNNIRSARSKRSMGLFQPFNLVEVLSYWKEDASIHRLSDIKLQTPLHRIQSDIRRTTLALFLSEILQKVFFHDQNEIRSAYHFVKESILALENISQGVENFHLQFLLKLAPHLGFGIEKAELVGTNDLSEEEIIDDLLAAEYGVRAEINGNQRYSILNLILRFYQTHIDYLSNIKSLQILHQIFH
jgi:DNA repair protein RecO (recombination protein O)